MPQKISYNPALTGLRAIAAHMVFLHHLITDQLLPIPLQHFYTGFIVFFVLSGYLISAHHLQTLKLNAKSLAEYFKRRFARIYPVYVLVRGIFLASHWEDQTIWTPEYLLMNFGLLKAWSNKYIYSGIGQAWTLTIEESFYFLAPVVFVYLRRGGSLLLLGLTATLLGWAHFTAAFFIDSEHLSKSLYSLTLNGFFFLLIPFFIGIFFSQATLDLRPKARAFLRKIKGLTWLALAILIAGIGMLEFDKPAPHLNYEFSLVQTFGVLLLVPLGAGLLIFALDQQRSLLSRFLGSRPMELLGKSSYVLDLIHTGVIALWLWGNFVDWGLGDATPYALILSINLLSILIFKLYEDPMAQFLRRFPWKATSLPNSTAGVPGA